MNKKTTWGPMLMFARRLGVGALLILTACTQQEVTQSVGKALEKSCQNNADHCTVYDETGQARR